MDKNENKKTAAKPAKKATKKKPFGKFLQFFKDLRSEVKKVVWPSKKQIKNNTLVVLGFMTLAAVFIWGVDFVMSLIVNLIFGA